ncbi:MAG TPA: hypothetical protein EYG92_07165 [Lutibacter sp.]|nr:hypothetical protein [Lutibacter sp.]
MKNFKLFFYTFTLLILFSSCTKDELTNSEKIVGKWKMTDFHGTTEATTSNSLMSITASSVQTGSNYNSFIDFTEGPNNYTITGSFNTHVTTTTVTVIGGETTTIVQEENFDSDDPADGTWAIEGDQITVTATNDQGEEESTTATIEELSDTTLTIKSLINTNTTVDGTTSTINAEFYQTYEKQ